MNYTATPKANGTNIRSGAGTNNATVGQIGINDKCEGDNLVKDATGKDWLEVIMLNNQQIATPFFVATWVCTMTTNPIPPVYPDFMLELSFSSDSEVTVTLPDGTIHKFATGLVKISASNPTMQLV
jgi:hypothetical protein